MGILLDRLELLERLAAVGEPRLVEQPKVRLPRGDDSLPDRFEAPWGGMLGPLPGLGVELGGVLGNVFELPLGEVPFRLPTRTTSEPPQNDTQRDVTTRRGARSLALFWCQWWTVCV